MVSPLSVSLALAMAYNGASGDTKAEMEEAMKLNGLTPEQINNSYKMLIEALLSLDEDVVFEIADAIFHEQNFNVKQEFLNLNETYFNAEIDSIDFSNPSAVTKINSWVADKTQNKIRTILDSLSPDDRMVLLNAIYFYGTWTKEFNKNGTKMRNFTMADGSNKEVPMMSKEDELDYLTNSLFSAVKLPYGSGQYNMLVLLPAEGENVQNVIDELSPSNWKNWSEKFERQNNIAVTMPRFKFAFDIQLNSVLQQMGMHKAFSPFSANFSNISDVDLFISSVIHKTYIDVNETGTEAAAVTALTFTTTSIDPNLPKTVFIVDKPFLFAVTEKDTDAILFIGEVQNPEYKE
ncbi:serpin family protein [Prolixibacteraceae bacterium Z1-6]|uniref:Serpin family protein n=1 Tax=Draconibacterium aestuarii TaxID=2998507 RepID=A0A9X3F4C8_9BACT|nr:serpin family protein [Prolixibacteraceae bacterium Z1-6]